MEADPDPGEKNECGSISRRKASGSAFGLWIRIQKGKIQKLQNNKNMCESSFYCKYVKIKKTQI